MVIENNTHLLIHVYSTQAFLEKELNLFCFTQSCIHLYSKCVSGKINVMII